MHSCTSTCAYEWMLNVIMSKGCTPCTAHRMRTLHTVLPRNQAHVRKGENTLFWVLIAVHFCSLLGACVSGSGKNDMLALFQTLEISRFKVFVHCQSMRGRYDNPNYSKWTGYV